MNPKVWRLKNLSVRHGHANQVEITSGKGASDNLPIKKNEGPRAGAECMLSNLTDFVPAESFQ
jgi:hypothetical protein